MNVTQSSYVKVIRGNKAGKLAFVLWQEAVHPELGMIWKVRFREPQLSTQISSDGGATFHDGIAFGRDALIPDAWLRPVEQQGVPQLVVERPPRANMSCYTYPREISEQRGRYDDQPTTQGRDGRSEQFARSGCIGRSP